MEMIATENNMLNIRSRVINTEFEPSERQQETLLMRMHHMEVRELGDEKIEEREGQEWAESAEMEAIRDANRGKYIG